MGLYDTFIDGEQEEQVKAFNPSLRVYRIGDVVDTAGLPKTCVIAIPDYSKPAAEGIEGLLPGKRYAVKCFVIIENGIFIGIKKYGPDGIIVFDKWGGTIPKN